MLQKLINALQIWEIYLNNRKFVSDWLDKAEDLVKENDDRTGIEEQKLFFEPLNESVIENFEKSGKELLKILPSEKQVHYFFRIIAKFF